jgi:hypothetical protein
MTRRMNIAARKRDVQRIIDEDPWDIVVHRRGETPDDEFEELEFVGRVQPAGMRSVAVERWSVELRGEHTVGRYSHGLLAPYDAPKLQIGDQVVATSQLDGNVVRRLECVYCSQYSYKVESLLDELE